MNKMFFVNSTLAIALTFLPSTTTQVMANSFVDVQKQVEASKNILRTKLADLNFFSANFTQDVVSEAGELLEQSSGKLAISKPNLANWHTIEPNELAIVSDGTDVWFYDPWIDQVSVYALSAAIAKTPILLLTSKDESLWQQYNVTQEAINESKGAQQEERFVISAKDANSQIKNLTLVFSAKNQLGSKAQITELSQFSFLDATGQISHIKLSSFDAQTKPDESLFRFTLPADVQVDDQRVN